MGDSRSAAAELENEVTICKYGAESLYFDRCTCSGCKLDAENNAKLRERKDRIKRILDKVLTEQPETKYDLIEEYLNLMCDETLIRDSTTGKLKQ